MQEYSDGLDFFYGSKNKATRMLEFLRTMVPIRCMTLCSMCVVSVLSFLTVYLSAAQQAYLVSC